MLEATGARSTPGRPSAAPQPDSGVGSQECVVPSFLSLSSQLWALVLASLPCGCDLYLGEFCFALASSVQVLVTGAGLAGAHGHWSYIGVHERIEFAILA